MIKEIEIKGINEKDLKYNSSYTLIDEINSYYYKNIFLTNIVELKNQIQDSTSTIKNIYIYKKIPNKLIIDIEEREIFAKIEFNNTKCVLVDDESYVIFEFKGTNNCDPYNGIYLVLQDRYKSFNIKKADNKYITDLLSKFDKLFSYKKLLIKKIIINDNLCEIEFNDNKLLVIDLTQNIDEQLVRFEIIYDELLVNYENFYTIDARFERPIVKK